MNLLKLLSILCKVASSVCGIYAVHVFTSGRELQGIFYLVLAIWAGRDTDIE